MNRGIVGGRFQIVKKLGGGYFSETYLAENIQQFRHKYLLKMLSPIAGSRKSFEKIKDLFEREAKALYELGGHHPQIPSLIAYFEEEEQLYLIREFIEGHDLRYELTPNKKIPEFQTIALLENILEPLAYLHAHKVIHRDIKPSNLMRRSADDKIFLIDFGAIRELAVTEVINTTGETRVTTIIGIPDYMPREQLEGKPQFASDIYAVGLIGIQAITGLIPQQIERDPETGELVWQHRGAVISHQLRSVLRKMVSYDRQKRYRTAIEALKAVREIKEISSSVSQNEIEKAIVILPSNPSERSTRVIGAQTLPKSPVYDSSIERRDLLKWAVLTCTGVGMALVGRSLFTRHERLIFRKISEPQLNNFSFEVVSVDARGRVIDRSTKEAQYFTEDLGNGVEIEMVAIAGGIFMMGSPVTEKGSVDNERPQHRVTVPPFFMGKYQVTQAEWREVASLAKVDRNLDLNPSYFKGDRLPVERVSWYDAVEFCQRLSRKTGRKYRLPREAEWEYACRAGTTTPFYFGPTITTDLANYDGNSIYASELKGIYRQKTTPVGSFHANAFGLYDMHGNVWEWCDDPWHENYKGAPKDGSAWIRDGNERASPLRGGSWLDNPTFCRSAYRYNDMMGRADIFDLIGFRVACVGGRN